MQRYVKRAIRSESIHTLIQWIHPYIKLNCYFFKPSYMYIDPKSTKNVKYARYEKMKFDINSTDVDLYLLKPKKNELFK